MKAVMMDLDGTLIDSIPLILESDRVTIKEFGFRVSKQKLRELAQLHSRDIAFWLMDNKRNNFRLESFVNRRRQNFKKLLKKEKQNWFKDAKSFIEKISKKYGVGIVTGSRWMFLEEVFDKEIMKKINFIVTSDDVEYKKPDIEPLRKAMQKMKVKRNEVLFIGDSNQDALMCSRAKIGFIGKTTGISTKRQLEKYKPIFIAKNFKEIEKFLGYE
jgi:HAD superfamily hydrolase (TIGR01549 family)